MANGRRGLTSLPPTAQALLDSEHSNMLNCVRCGLCLTSCPTYILTGNEAESPRGRVAMMRALAEGTTALTPDLTTHEYNCLVCDACTAVCPAGVSMDPLQVALRSAIEPKVRRPLWQRAVRRFTFRTIFADMRLFRLVVSLLWFYQRSGLQRLVRQSGLLRLLGLAQSEALLPRLPGPGTYLRPHGRRYPAERAAEAHGQVSLFAGCVMSTAFAGIDRATIRVCQRAGYEVVATAGQGCCGALNAHGGDIEGMLELAKRNIAAFEQDGDAPIIVNSAGCGAMLKEYGHHLRDDPAWAERAHAFSARVKDATEFLVPENLPMRRSIAARVTYQEPCHLAHAQRITRQPRALLRAIPGLELSEMRESSLCCGSAGIYNITNPREAGELQQRKLDNATATEAATLVTANPGCHLHLQAGLRERGSTMRVRHIIELLDEATRP